jgi:hypothetical protein
VPRRDHARKPSTGSPLGRCSARLAAIGLAALAAGALAAPAQAQAPVGAGIGTGPIGPIVERFGFFPEYYTDALGTKLQLCVFDPACAVLLPNPSQPISFPGNFPDEMFYWLANADAGGAGLVLAQEATFDGVDGNQAVFGRLRVRVRDIPVGHYRFTTPYGQFEATTNGQTDQGLDVGCGPAIGPPCDPTTFPMSAGSAIGPNYLTAAGAPAGFVGDGASTTTVTGSVFTPTLASVDALPPAISLGVTAASDTQDNAGTVAVQFNPSALDDVDGVRPANCAPTPARLPAAATTNTTCSSTDLSTPSNTGTRVFHVAVPDTTPPHITAPTGVSVGSVNPDGTTYNVQYTINADDIVDGNRPVSCDHAPGSAFPAGATTVSCTSADASASTSTATFTVTVTPDPPVIPGDPPPGTAQVAITGFSSDEPVDPVVPVVTADAQINPAPAIANYFRVDQIDNGGNIVGHFGATHRTTGFTILGKLADAVAQPQFLSTGGAFGSVHVGDPLTQSITVRNGGSGPLNLTTANITGSTDFALISNGCAGTPRTVDPAPRTLPATTPVNGPCTITVRFTPSAVADRTATLTVNEGGIPHTVALTGAGTLAAIGTNPAGLSFGSQRVGLSTVPQSIVVTNTGGSPLNIAGVSFTGTGAADYNATATGCTNMAPGATCTVDVMFTPTAAGIRNATLQIATNEAGTRAIPVSGTGVAGPAPAGGGGGVIAPVITPSKKSLKSLTLKVGPKRDALLPLRFTISGELKVPAGVSLKSTCAGNVTITLKRGLKTVVKSTPKLRLIAGKTRCVYSSKVTIRTRALVGARTSSLRAGVRYAGSSALKSASRFKSVRVR